MVVTVRCHCNSFLSVLTTAQDDGFYGSLQSSIEIQDETWIVDVIKQKKGHLKNRWPFLRDLSDPIPI